MVLAMVKRKNKSQCGEEDLPDAQKDLLLYILQHGPSPAYGTHKILKRPQSTVQTSMKELKDAGLVGLYGKEEGEKGGTKLMYGLTLHGFCYGFNLIVRSETTTYELIERLINRWQHLCPVVLGNWNHLIAGRQEDCSFPEGCGERKYFWEGVQLPYQVPNMKVKHWIIFINGICAQTSRESLYREATPETFISFFCEQVYDQVINRPDISDDPDYRWDIEYILCVIRNIPELWEYVRRDLVCWRESFRRSDYNIQWALNEWD